MTPQVCAVVFLLKSNKVVRIGGRARADQYMVS